MFSATLVGLILRLIWELWIGEGRATGNVVLGLVVVMTMVVQESNLSILLGGLFYAGLVFWIIEAVFRNWFGTQPTPPT